ncbi:DNA-binding IclR family transcriptional regulator [Microbacterium sp. SORGH_AS428]|uniref:IclR family transcriptional regulator n=1 Tax=Microbacterium sp. SORGH_AS_0428 TaxID=3041788 RepID=UPI002858D53E|nr:IclR family transcriptional regulator [Microbacterium sp. SORGH_AS_0428]MDR6199603.1 DNA-binding IclR family transcriptional regulator [Microbacterium sp. SORGH_AS_0428]
MADGVLRRAMALMRAFDEDAPELTAAELAERAGLPLSTVHRLLAQLIGEGLVERTSAHTYAVGARMWELGELSPLALRLREQSLPHLVRLYEATGENVHLAVLEAPTPPEGVVLFAGRITGRASVPTLGRAGGRHPLHTTGVGRALLATCDEGWLDTYLAAPLVPETRHSITDPDVLRADIGLTRRRGYAVTREEMTLGNISVAAALGTISGLPATALGVVTHLDGADERRLAPLVVQAAKDLTKALRGSDSH